MNPNDPYGPPPGPFPPGTPGVPQHLQQPQPAPQPGGPAPYPQQPGPGTPSAVAPYPAPGAPAPYPAPGAPAPYPQPAPGAQPHPQQGYPQQSAPQPQASPPQPAPSPSATPAAVTPAVAPGGAEYAVAFGPPGWGKAISLYFKTLGCTISRALTSFLVSGVGIGLLVVGLVAAVIGNQLGGSTVAGIACVPFMLVAAVWLWFTSGWVIKTYVGHTAVVTELIRTGRLETQGKGVAAHGVALAEQVFGEVGNVMNYQRNFDHVLGSVEDSIAAGVAFLPSSLARWLRALIKNARRYLSWVMISYVFATRQPDQPQQDIDTVVLHAFAQTTQSWKKMLSTILFSVVAEGLLLLPVWVFGGLAAIGGWGGAAYAITSASLATSSSGMPAEMAAFIPIFVAGFVGLFFGLITTFILVGLQRDLVVRPICLIRAMLYFHHEVASRPFNRQLLAQVSKLEDLAERLDRSGSDLGEAAGLAGQAFGAMKGFMGGD